MAEEISVVTADKIKKFKMDINSNIDSLLREALSISRLDTQGKIYVKEEIDLDEKEMVIYKYIADNPESTNQKIVDFFKDRPGYSRNPVYATIRRLQQYGLITVKLDKNNKQQHRLSINNENMLVSYIQVLNYFKNIYFNLIDKTKPFISKEYNLARITPVELVECLIMFYKFIKDRFSDFFLWHGKLCDRETIYRKFVVIYGNIDEMRITLHQSLVDADFIKSSGEMELFVNRSRSEVLDPENLTFVVNSFEKCGLRKYVEPVIDMLWNLFYTKLPELYNEYAHLASKSLLRDWRDIIEEEVKNFSHKRKLVYCPPSN